MGFMAIIFASKGDVKSLAIAGALIFVGAFFDLTDGAVARALNVASPIGVQLDSLADAVTYGIAPGIIAYNAYLNSLPYICCEINLGMIIALFFPVCAIYRLARFNITESSNGFDGLPSPAAGILVASIPCLAFNDFALFNIPAFSMPVKYYVPIYIGTALLMVSKVDYRKLFTDLARKGKPVFISVVVLLMVLFALFRMWAVFIFTSIYIFFGFIRYIIKFNK